MKYLRQFSIYTLVGFIGAGVGFFLMPYLSHFLQPAQYGILSMVNSLVTILIPLIGLTVSGIINVEYYRQKDNAKFASLFSSVQFIPVLPFLLCLIICIIGAVPIARFLEIPTDKSYWIPVCCVLAYLTIYYETLLAYNVAEQRPRYYAFFNVLKLMVEVSLTIIFVTHFNYGWEGRLMAWLIACVLMSAISFFYFHKRHLLTTNIKKADIQIAVLFGLPLILHAVGKFMINQSDRIFIAKMVSIKEAGIYNIGYQVGAILLIFVSAMANFFQPFLYERLAELTEQAKKQIVKLSYGLVAALFVLLLLMTFLAPLFFKWFIDENYAKGIRYVFWIGLSYFFWSVYVLFASYIFYSGKTKVLGILAIVNVVLNIIFNYFFILEYGALGSAYATCLSFFIVGVTVVLSADRLYPMPWFGPRRTIGNGY